MSSSAYGNNTDIQFNDSGYANGSDSFTFNKNNLTVTVANTLISGNQSVSVGSAGITGYSYSGCGVLGIANSGVGLQGYSNSNIAVSGGSNTNVGVYGQSNSYYGGYFISNTSISIIGQSNTGTAAYFSTNTGLGLYVQSDYQNLAVFSNGSANLVTIYANGQLQSTNSIDGGNTSGTVAGVSGYSGSSYGGYFNTQSGTAAFGISVSGNGVEGVSNTGTAVYGKGNNGIGVFGYSNNSVGGYFSSCTNIGVEGVSINNYPAVQGTTNNNSGVAGFSTYGSGVFGQSNSWYGVYGNSNAGTAGFFNSNTGIGLSVQSNTNTIAQYSNASGVVASMDNYGTRYKNGATITPWINVVTDFGASPSATAATNTTAFNNAIALANETGATIYIPPGTYYVNSLSAITYPGVQVIGAGMNATTISMCQASGNIFSLSTGSTSSAYYCKIMDMSFVSNCFRTGGFDIYCNSASCCQIRNIKMAYCYDGINITSCGNSLIDNVNIQSPLGTVGILYNGYADGVNGGGTYGAWLNHFCGATPSYQTDAQVDLITTWGNSKAFTQNQFFTLGDWIWECTVAGTSQSSGTLSLPTSSLSSPFTNNWVTSGTAQFQLVMQSGLTWIWMDSYVSTLVVKTAQCLGGWRGFYMHDGTNVSGSAPYFAYFYDLECDHNYNVNVECDGGAELHMTSCLTGDALGNSGIYLHGNYQGGTCLRDIRAFAAAQHGIRISSGVEHIISDSFLVNAGQSGSGYAGIYIDSGVQRFSINGNRTGIVATQTSTPQAYGIYVASGDSDYYSITNNIGYGNLTASVSDNGTGTHKINSPNI